MGWSSCFRLVVFTLLLGSVVGGVFGVPRTAQADPHAIFYTAIGQQQLFFNVLAALDQADYVETQLDRQGRVSRRATVPTTPRFTAEQQPLIGATNVQPPQSGSSSAQPGVSAVLTRLLTLEGNDLYTDELVRQLAVEVGRRNSTDELLRVLCDFALGLKDCEQPSPDLAEQIQDPNSVKLWETQVRDPVEWSLVPFWNGVWAALKSGYSGSDYDDQANRRAYLNGQTVDGQAYRARRPVAYSPVMAYWNARAAQLGGGHREMLGALIDDALEQYGPDEPTDPAANPYPFEGLVVNANGSITVEADTWDEYLIILQRVLHAPETVSAIAAAAQNRVALQLEALEEQGLLASYTLKPQLGIEGQIGELSALIEVPKAARVGTAYSLPLILGQLDTSQQFASPEGVNVRGRQQLVNRPPAGSVQGAQDGSVAGAYSVSPFNAELGYALLYQANKEPTSPAANIVPGHQEDGALHTLDAITNGDAGEKIGARHGQGGYFR